MGILNLPRAGDLDHKVTIRTKGAADADDGSWTETPADLAALVPARIDTLRGREFVEARKVNAEAGFKITVRPNSAVVWTSDLQIVFGTRVFELTEPARNIGERDKMIVCICKETE